MNFFVTLMVIIGVSFIIELLELMRRASGKEAVDFDVVLRLALFKLPMLIEKTAPFAVLIGGMLSLTKLSKSQELVAARASGVSVWQFLMPGLAAMLVLGIFFVTVFNPVSAALLSRFQQMEAKYLKGRASMLSVSASGLWIKQSEPDGGFKIVHSLRITPRDMTLYDVIVFVFTPDGNFSRRIDAESANLIKNHWVMHDALITSPNAPSERKQELWVETNLTANEIQNSFAPPETLSFWELGGFVYTLEKAGFSGLEHRMHWHWILSRPLTFCGMLLIAAAFSLQLKRGRSLGFISVGVIITGFIIYFLSDIIYAFGQSGSLPVLAAAWTPAVMTTFLGTAALLHFEDG